MDFARKANEAVLQFTWSLWAELGVPGWTRLHRGWWIDPEALLLFAPHVESLDARLAEEVEEWVRRHQRFLSTGRIKNMRKGSSRLERSSPTSVTGDLLTGRGPRSLHPEAPREGRGVLDFSRPAQLSLRLRALFGVGARAEIMRVFLLHEAGEYSARQMAAEATGFTKRAVQLALEDFDLAGICTMKKSGNVSMYSLEQHRPIAAMGFGEKLVAPRWIPIFECLATILEIAVPAEETRGTVETLKVRSAAKGLDQSVETAGLPRVPHDIRGEAFFDAFRSWALDIVTALASGSFPARGLDHRSNGEP